MFGSLRIDRQRVTDEQRATYRAHFCGGCHALHELGGRGTSLLTNYDQTVLALVLGALQRKQEIVRASCTAAPWRRVGVATLSAENRALLAALDVAAVEAKLLDDVEDERRWRHRLGLVALVRPRRRARAALEDLGFPVAVFDDLPARQRAAEALPRPRLRDLAEPSAELGAASFAFAAKLNGHDDLEPVLAAFGRAVGAWVYAWDAVDDRLADRRRGRFNALDACFGEGDAAGAAEAFLVTQLDVAARALHAFPGNEATVLLRELVGSLRRRVRRDLPARATAWGEDASHLASLRPAEAGECDCGACDACDLGGCSSGPDVSGSSCDICSCCDICWCWGDRGRRRKEDRQMRNPDRA